MSNLFGAKSEEEFLTSPFYAPVRQAMMAKKDVIERLAREQQVGGPMEDEDQNMVDEDAAESPVVDDEMINAYASMGGLSAMNLTDPNQISQAIIANAAKQQQYYDNLANQIKQRRYGPSETEKLLALSSAFFAPTSVRGFSGTMGNVLPVLQKFGELRRTGEEKRTEALQGLAKQRATLAQGDIKTAIDLQRLMASYNKPQWVRTENKETGEVTLTPMYPNSNNAPSDGFPSINLEDLKTLVNNPQNIPLPDLMAFFNKRYGENVAQKILGVK